MPVKKHNFTKTPKFGTDVPPYSGLVVTEEMKRLIFQPGFLNRKNGGNKLRDLYMQSSMGFNPNELSDFGRACYCGSLEWARQLMEYGKVPPLNETESPFQLGYASCIVLGSQRVEGFPGGPQPNHLGLLKFLIQRGLPLSIPDIVGYTPLHHSVMGESRQDKAQIIRALLEGGADVHFQNRWGESPLLPAMVREDILGIELFMEFGADVNLPDGDGTTAMMCHIPNGPRVAAAIDKWVKIRAGEKGKLTEKRCDNCGQEGKGLKKCARCLTVQYCSRECQTSSWKAHKKVCVPMNKSTTVTVTPHYPQIPGAVNVSMSPFIRGTVLGLPTQAVPETHFRYSHIPENIPPEGKQVVIKVQVPQPLKNPDGTYNEMRVYTRKRDLVCHILRPTNVAAYDELLRVILEKGMEGKKAYFVADLRSPKELVIKVSEVLAAQPW
ncbi:hypothetical protein CC1G_10759 [Coprinopsis cinerea okayama7|uniref:MYND-type domain-containing protein n=1 Tax=Coprinopsis cinerea (strain Okayama-7 / 130 / ATCC MYA-4618 / FGSC 9003) TaxID=240176 RepID=A8P3B9_COPC7|nr:hypothetical protein CC1G_10759 [Coprinopsis cinerea okayama7\|eukprot:XP_001838517.2 hypothetical protein CC1G_10759 [Coprinopsis cinerea okayama7\